MKPNRDLEASQVTLFPIFCLSKVAVEFVFLIKETDKIKICRFVKQLSRVPELELIADPIDMIFKHLVLCHRYLNCGSIGDLIIIQTVVIFKFSVQPDETLLTKWNVFNNLSKNECYK